jgi:hypothetical protein
MPKAYVEMQHFTTPDTGSYDYSYTSLNVIQVQETYKNK